MSKALIFPGQGSQIVGMGKDIADTYSEARHIFQEIDDALDFHLSKIIFEGTTEELNLTENTQPALMAVSMAILEVLKKQIKFNPTHAVVYLAGHSLGEYTALAAAESLSIPMTAKLLKYRGKAMQESSPLGQGSMAALIGVTVEEAENIVNQAKEADICQIANDNTIGQIVISGDKVAIQRASLIAQAESKKFIELAVSAAFHSKLMSKATEKMSEILTKTELKQPILPLISNVTAESVSEPSEIKNLLVKQIEHRVRWRESVLYMINQEVDHFIEIGSGKVLTGLIKRINSEVKTSSVNNLESINQFMEIFV